MGLEDVEIVFAIEEAFAVRITDDDAVKMKTPRDVIDFVASRVPVSPDGPCLEQSAFYLVRSTLKEIAGRNRGTIRPSTPLAHVFVLMEPRAFARELNARLGLHESTVNPQLTTVGDLARKLVSEQPEVVRRGRPWTRLEIASIVRRRILDVLGEVDYGEEKRFVEDLGVG